MITKSLFWHCRQARRNADVIAQLFFAQLARELAYQSVNNHEWNGRN